jgi:hypothetical protein
LRVRAVENEGCALRRCLPGYDAALDIGQYRSTLHLVNSLETFQIEMAGEDVTTAIERDLNLDRPAAEKRKRILGTAGAGERARTDLVASLRSLITSARDVTPCQRVAVIGNGARLPALLRDLASATGATFEFAVSHVLDSESYGRDVLCLGAPDWTLAAALAG